MAVKEGADVSSLIEDQIINRPLGYPNTNNRTLKLTQISKRQGSMQKRYFDMKQQDKAINNASNLVSIQKHSVSPLDRKLPVIENS